MKKKILIVDDSSMSRRILRRILESVDHEVVEAGDGAAGLEQFYLEKPDLVFLDLTMRDMYGLDVLSNLREIDPDICVIIASADIQDSTREMVTAAGANAFINKPLSPEKVLEVLEKVKLELKAA